MTKQQFLSGVPFTVKGHYYKGAPTFYYDECIIRQSRSSIDERVITRTHHANIQKVGRVGFTGYTFVIEKMVVVKYRFEDLVPFKIQEA